jgi:nitrite reductase (NO-forming)
MIRSSSLVRLGVVAVFALAVAACADDGPDARGPMGGAMGGHMSGSASGQLTAGSGSDQTPISPGDTVEFYAGEFMFAPADFLAEPGTYNGVLVNDGEIIHDITFEGGEPIVAAAGETVEFEFSVPEEGVRYWCSIPGHEDAGMVGMVNTTASLAAADTASAGDGDSHAVASGTQTVEANPDAAPYALRDPRVPARGEGEGMTLVPGGAPDGGDLIEWELVVEEKLMTVAEGYEQLVWTYGGEVPGPVLRTRVGDTVRVHLVNPPEASVAHSIDFHASQVSMDD